jgi:hypothetical protein
VLDIGTQHDEPEHGLGSGLRDSSAIPSAKTRANDRIDAAALDSDLSQLTFKKGIGAAIAASATSDIIVNRDGFQQTVGIAPVQAAFDSLPGGLRFEPRGGDIAPSRDLAYSFGIARWSRTPAEAPRDSGVFMHVWRREGGKKWKLALAVENPLVNGR